MSISHFGICLHGFCILGLMYVLVIFSCLIFGEKKILIILDIQNLRQNTTIYIILFFYLI